MLAPHYSSSISSLSTGKKATGSARSPLAESHAAPPPDDEEEDNEAGSFADEKGASFDAARIAAPTEALISLLVLPATIAAS